ncbi:hypothetical protein Tco_1337535 [Tanacetum coccineum]
MVREHIGLKIPSWKKVDSEARDKLWDEITKLVIAIVLVMLSKNSEGNETGTYILPNQNTLSKLNEVSAKYSAILQAKEWVNFVKYIATEEYKVKSAAAKMARSKSVYQHTMGRGGYATVVKVRDMGCLRANILINSNADEEGGTTIVGCENDASIQKFNKTSPCETVQSVGSRSIRKDSSRQDSQS